MKTEGKYSVLMSVYYGDRPDWLRLSIESILNQTVSTDDFVIVCDGPLSKELNKVLDEYSEKNDCVHVFHLQKNMGLGIALAFGVERCKNELIARMDADDISLNCRAELELQLHGSGNYDVVGGEILEFIDDPERPVAIRNVPEYASKERDFFIYRNPLNHVSVMFKKSSVLRVGNYCDMPYREDYYLWIRMLEKGATFYNIQKPLVLVRAGDAMYRRRAGKQMLDSCISLARYMKNRGFLTNFEYIKVLLIWIGGATLPTKVRKKIYNKSFRCKLV